MVKAFTRNIHIVLLIQRLLSLVLLGLTPAIAIAETLDVSVDKADCTKMKPWVEFRVKPLFPSVCRIDEPQPTEFP